MHSTFIHSTSSFVLLLAAGIIWGIAGCSSSGEIKNIETREDFERSHYISPADFGYPLSIREYASMDTAGAAFVPPRVAGGMRRAFAKVRYPQEAIEKGIKGKVVLQLYVSRQGELANIALVESPDPLLTAAAVEAARQWRYQPATLRTIPVNSFFRVPLNFRMQTIETKIESHPVSALPASCRPDPSPPSAARSAPRQSPSAPSSSPVPCPVRPRALQR